MTRPAGFVSLVGAGPGDPGLLTLAGRDRLANADVVVYDRLVGSEIVGYANPKAEMIFAGKEPGRHALTQDQINALLVEKGAAGCRVVRLKGGDPFVFGRGGEEALALAAAGVPFEVIPGVTSAVAAPAYAGVPVTHRGIASSFAVITGHEDDEKDEGSVDWRGLARTVDTIVVLMGGAALAGISRALVEGGRPPETPAVSVQWGTTDRQRSVIAPLSDIATAVNQARLGTPLLTVIGDVASLREQVAWFESRPLYGKTVLVTRATHQAGTLSGLLRAKGARVFELPVLEIVPREDDDTSTAVEALARGGYDWCAFTSTNGVEIFWHSLQAAGKDARAFHCRIAAIGKATAAALEARGLVPDVVAGDASSEGILAALKATGLSGADVLLPTAARTREVLAQGLREAGAKVHELAIYETKAPAAPPPEAALAAIRAGEIDAVTFASSSAVTNLASILGADFDHIRTAVVACIGPITAATAREYGLEVAVAPTEHTITAFVDALAARLADRK